VNRLRSADERVVWRAARRIGLQTAASLAVALVGLAGVIALVDLHGRRQSEDLLLDRSIARADVTDPPSGVWLVIRHDGRDSSTPEMPPGLPDGAELDEASARRAIHTINVTVHGGEYRVTTEPLPDGGAIQAVLDLQPDNDQQQRLLEAFLIAGLAGLVVSAGIGFLLARLAVQPLATALTLQRRFVADAGHELRTPLTLLTTRAQLIRRALRTVADADLGTVRSDVERLVADAHHLTAILEDMLLAVDPREIRTDEQVSLPSVVADVVESARPLADEFGVVLSCATAGEPPPVAGAQAALRRAVTALVDNAIRHADGEVRVSISAGGGDVVVDVADDGPGIAPEIASTLFDRFATSPSDGLTGTSRRYGIGLALVSEIAARHGGTVSVAGSGHHGATLRLRIPVG
jgi:two-component system, OmpR family, sensor kinase